MGKSKLLSSPAAFRQPNGDEMGLTVATDGLQEYEILPADGTIAVTVLRSIAELGDWGYFPTPEAQCLGFKQPNGKCCRMKKMSLHQQAFVDAYQYKVPASGYSDKRP